MKRTYKNDCFHLWHNERLLYLDGFARLSSLQKMNEFKQYTKDDILKVARLNPRFELTKTQGKFIIQAKYGHSVPCPNFKYQKLMTEKMPDLFIMAQK